MSADRIVELARALPPGAVGALGALAAFLVVLAVAAQLAARQLQLELREAEEELVDRRTGLLPRSALRVRLGAELAWAATSRTPLSVAVLRIRGSRFLHAAQVLRHAMRGEENAFLLGDQHVAVELWGADEPAAVVAITRLGRDLARSGHPVVDAGIACSPRDGTDVDTLLAAARSDLRPVEDALGAVRSGQPRRPLRALASRTAGVLASLGALSLLLLVAWRLLPAALEPALEAGGRSPRELAYALVALVGLPLGAALLHVACWELPGSHAPSSRPLRAPGWRSAAAVASVVAAPLAWAVFAPAGEGAVAGTLAVLALVVLALLHARQLVHLPVAVLAPLGAIGAAVTWACVVVASYPVVANAGRLLAAAALGALLARFVERASWLVFLASLAAVVDAWSVFASSGVTSQLLEAEGGAAGRLVDLLLFTGPVVGEAQLFAIGATDLVFLSLFLCWAHDWRLDMRVVAAALLAATWGTILVGELRGEAVPMLPLMAVAMVLVLAGRSALLRSRVAAWRRLGLRGAEQGDDDGRARA